MLTCNQTWQRAFARRLAERHELALVVVDEHFSPASRAGRVLRKLRNPLAFARKAFDKLAVATIEARDRALYHAHFERLGAPRFESSARNVLFASQINSAEVARAIDSAGPDAILVSGTRLIRAPVIDCQARLGMINLHTGLSPYYRGGPCTFWTLHNEEPEYAGATVHYITAGIDSGDIILSGRPDLSMEDGVASLDSKVIDLGHRLMLRALELLEKGHAPRVPQWEKGKLFLYKQFTAGVRRDLERKLAGGLMERALRRVREHHQHLRTIEET